MEYRNSLARAAIEEVVHSERDRRLMIRRLIDGICMEPLAEEFQLSVSQVKRIIRKESEKIFRYMSRK